MVYRVVGFLAVFGLALCFCAAAFQTTGPTAPPTFYHDVVPILQNHCQSCHRPGEIAPMPFVTYEQTQPRAKQIAAAVQMKMMPPWFADPRYGRFANDPSLTAQEVATISAWAEAGAPAGDPHNAPPPRKWTEGWNIAQPDQVVKMPKPVQIPARGEVEYTYEIVPTHFEVYRWVQMSELRPGSPAHVHHAVVYIRPPDRTLFFRCTTRPTARQIRTRPALGWCSPKVSRSSGLSPCS